jgi:predicted nucleic acid-binding protein
MRCLVIFFSSFQQALNKIAERAVNLRRDRYIKWPDAIIWATAQARAMLLVTRNTKDFAADDPGVRMPYRL